LNEKVHDIQKCQFFLNIVAYILSSQWLLHKLQFCVKHLIIKEIDQKSRVVPVE